MTRLLALAIVGLACADGPDPLLLPLPPAVRIAQEAPAAPRLEARAYIPLVVERAPGRPYLPGVGWSCGPSPKCQETW